MKTSSASEEIRAIRSAERDSIWIAGHYKSLQKRYDREFIAVYGRKVIDHDRSGPRLTRRLKRKYPAEQPGITVTYVTLEKVDLIL